jgi:hypothetical protein
MQGGVLTVIKGVQVIKEMLNWASDRSRRVLGLGEFGLRPVRFNPGSVSGEPNRFNVYIKGVAGFFSHFLHGFLSLLLL